jgi:hypothetical protein
MKLRTLPGLHRVWLGPLTPVNAAGPDLSELPLNAKRLLLKTFRMLHEGQRSARADRCINPKNPAVRILERALARLGSDDAPDAVDELEHAIKVARRQFYALRRRRGAMRVVRAVRARRSRRVTRKVQPCARGDDVPPPPEPPRPSPSPGGSP